MSSDPVAAAIASARIPHNEPSSLHSDALPHSGGSSAGPSRLQRSSSVSSAASSSSSAGPVVYEAKSTLPRVTPPRRKSAAGLATPSDGRGSVESVGFGYEQHLLPLSMSARIDDDADDDLAQYASARTRISYGDREGEIVEGGRSPRREERRMGLVDGIALTVGLQIGSGIFSSPGVVTLNTGSIGASLVVWLVSGILAWTGASSFAELGAAIPLNGGAQAYLNYSFGPLSAYLFAWTAIVALKPGSGAIIAIIFAEYVARVIFHTTSTSAADPHEQGLAEIPPWSIKLIAVVIVVLISTVHAFSSRLATRGQVATTAVKLLALVAVPILAIVVAARGKMPDASKHAFSSIGNLFEGSSQSPSNYALALYSGLWAYDGWDQSTIVAGEIKNVTKNLPRVIHSSLSIVLCIFLLTVSSYFVVLAPQLVAQTNTVALDFGSAIAGTVGGVFFACLVAFSCLGALNGQFYTSARFVYTAGKEGYLPKMFGRTHARTKTPVAATALQAALVIVFILFGSGFASLVNFYGVCSWSGYLFTVLGLLVLRIKEPHLERPYQTYITTPILFSAVALFLLFMPIFSAPLEALAAAAFILAGVPMYFLTQRRVLSPLFARRERDAVPQHKEVLDEAEDDEEALEMLPSHSER